MIKLMGTILVSLMIIGCNTTILTPNIEQKKQISSKITTDYHFKIVDFKNMLNKSDIKPVYIYIQNIMSLAR